MDRDELLRLAAELVVPDAAHAFDVPRVPDVPIEQDVRDTVERLIELERLAASIPDYLRAIDDVAAQLAFQFPQGDAPLSDFEVMTDAWEHVRAVRDDWLDFQSLLSQQIAYWQSAAAVMEHDIAWQDATASSGLRAACIRPSVAASISAIL